ncbi:E3 ubiquitin-protein ligase FANCL-like [Daktulosphaira vitifoliae]|uniref:E3 ubiquitin-protein ligase FANCL-like n=1 Tax=Daktulosphaira vitifoliae TaxID=58002 RepID=UPI0021AAD651|nr:E3 ubiquitin-protein ligase FANCL-like [Daktulosphaira vitifoliae]
MSELQDMFEKFPLLLPSNDNTVWIGVVLLKSQYQQVEIICPSFPNIENIQFNISTYENFNLDQFELNKIIEQFSKNANVLPEFLSSLIDVLNKSTGLLTLPQVNISHKINQDRFCSIIQEIKIWDKYVYDIEENLCFVTYKINDESGRQHSIKIHIPIEYPAIKKSLEFDATIPTFFMNSLLKINIISGLFEEFKNIIATLSHFWDLHDEIVNTCNLIGTYSLADVKYRIPIEKHVIAIIEIDPINHLSLPRIELYGRIEDTDKFQKRLNKFELNSIWSTDKSFKDNLMELFEIKDLASQYEEIENPIEEFEQNSNYCFICYGDLDKNSKKHTKVCANNKCDAVYHMSCICEWMLNSGSTPAFKHLQGKCPQCEEKLLVALEDFDIMKKN